MTDEPVFDEDGQCSKCGTFDEVHSCWHCDISLCIECDPGEMRSDLDGHTYCDKHGPDSTMTVKELRDHLVSQGVVRRPKTIHPEDAPTCEECGGQIEHSTLLFTFPPENGLCECPNVIEWE